MRTFPCSIFSTTLKFHQIQMSRSALTGLKDYYGKTTTHKAQLSEITLKSNVHETVLHKEELAAVWFNETHWATRAQAKVNFQWCLQKIIFRKPPVGRWDKWTNILSLGDQNKMPSSWKPKKKVKLHILHTSAFPLHGHF